MRYWRRGLWVGAVIATGAVVAVTARDGLNATGPLVAVLGLFVALAGLLYSTARPPTTTSPDEQLDRSADALARAVLEQWQSEWRLRRLQDPEPLAVHWAPAAAWLSDLDDTIGRPPEAAQRPDLIGQLPEIAELFELVPSRRLVVLGAPGSGKTVLAVRFTLDLLDRRTTGDPVPVLFHASTWQPDRQSLREWLADSLIAAHPTLATEGTSGSVLAKDLVATGRILPVVDGLDEMPAPLRTKAVWRLNTELDTDSPLLLTCRSTVYSEVVEAGDVLTSAAVVELQPLGFEEAARFLVRTARPVRGPGGERATAWDPVLDQVRRDPDAPASRCLRQVLSLPLMVAMARAVYGDTGADPAELLHRRGLATSAALEQHLLDAFVPASFRTSTRYDEAEVAYWLRSLARHLERRGTRNLAWWELHWALPRPLRTVAPLLLVGVVAEVVCLIAWLVGGSAGPPVAGAAVVLGLCVGHVALSRDDLGPRRKLLLSIACVVPLGMVTGIFQPLAEYSYGSSPSAVNELLGWLAMGALYGVSMAIVLAVIGITRTPTPATMPFPVMASKRYGRWAWKTMSGLMVGAMVYLPFYLADSAGTPLLVAVAITGVLLGAYVVRGGGATAVHSGDPRGGRRRSGAVGRFGRALVQGLSVGLLAGIVLALAFSLTEGGTAAARAAARADFPVSGPVHRSSDGGRYVVADDGTRYGLRPDGDTYIKQDEPLNWSVVEYSDGSVNFVLTDSGGLGDSCERAPCSRLRAALEVSVNINSRPSPFVVRLPDGRFATWADAPEALLESREGHWMNRQTPGRLLGSALSFGIFAGLGLGIVSGFAAGLHRWLGAPVDIARTPSPLASLLADRDTGVVRGFLIMIVGAICVTLLVLVDLPRPGVVALLVLLPTGLIAFVLSAWGHLLTARLWLCPPGLLPWRLMAFLAEAHERGVLRQAGAVYQFRHARLQERLATAREEDQEG
ncbi:NACHT domain-containing protein [Streptomyces sp. 2A115]|uniref:NACHT domain-containing protein n=1 Tax=Streptomyces sp. 2A115 TaxID=3457439 RepID=UPI003FCF696E